MKKSLLAIPACALLTGSPAFAADLALKAPPPAPVDSWNGCYVGANGGSSFGNRTGTISGFTPDFASTVTSGNNVPGSLGVRPESAFGGGQIGCNWQTGQWVLSGETDFQGSGIQNSTTISLPGNLPEFVPSTSTGHEDLQWFGTVRGRIGVAVIPQLLAYATGGFAYGRVSDSASTLFTPAISGAFVGSAVQTRLGWTVGAGAEYAVLPNLSVKVEYLYINLGTSTVTEFDPVHFPASSISYSFTHADNVVRAGLNWRFW
jgi:outer membrane immunogenic protein